MAGIPPDVEEHGFLVTGFVESALSVNQLQYRQTDGTTADYTGPGLLKTLIVNNETQYGVHTLTVYDDRIEIFRMEVPPQNYGYEADGTYDANGVIWPGGPTFVYHFPEPGLYFSGPLQSKGETLTSGSQIRCTAIAQSIDEDALATNSTGVPPEIEEHGFLISSNPASASSAADALEYRTALGVTATYTGAGFIKSIICYNKDTDSAKVHLTDNLASGGAVEILQFAVSPIGPTITAPVTSAKGPHGAGTPLVINFPEPGIYFAGTLQQHSTSAYVNITIVAKTVDEEAAA